MSVMENRMRKGIAEILTDVSMAATHEERVNILKKNDSEVLRGVLYCAFHPGVEWDLPEGVPPYKPNKLLDQQGMLFREWRRMGTFIKGAGSDKVPQAKREQLYIQLLESLDEHDAKLLVAIKDGKMPFKHVTRSLLLDAFGIELPEAFRDGVTKKTKRSKKDQEPEAKTMETRHDPIEISNEEVLRGAMALAFKETPQEWNQLLDVEAAGYLEAARRVLEAARGENG